MMAIGDRSSPEKSSSPNGIWLIRELSLDRAVGAARSSATTDAGGAAPAHSCRPARPVFGLCCRQLDGAVRQQCAGHLPFERHRLKLGERLQAVLSIDCSGAVADATASVTNGLALLRSSRPGHEVV